MTPERQLRACCARPFRLFELSDTIGTSSRLCAYPVVGLAIGSSCADPVLPVPLQRSDACSATIVVHPSLRSNRFARIATGVRRERGSRARRARGLPSTFISLPFCGSLSAPSGSFPHLSWLCLPL